MLEILPSRQGQVLICGHRGHSIEGHENTRPALRRAAELGAALCEIDLRMTADGQLIVFHDDILDHSSTGTGLIARENYDKICKFRTKNRHGLTIEPQQIEKFEDILSYSRALGLSLIVEIKDKFVDDDYLQKVIKALEDSAMLDHVLISSFDYVVLRDIKRLAPTIRIMGINYHHLVDPVATAETAMMNMLNTDYPQFSNALAEKLHAADIAVSHYLPVPSHFELRRGYGFDYLAQLEAFLVAGHIDMLVCDDVAWMVDFVTKCGLKPVKKAKI